MQIKVVFFLEFPEYPDRYAILEGEVSAHGCARRDAMEKDIGEEGGWYPPVRDKRF